MNSPKCWAALRWKRTAIPAAFDAPSRGRAYKNSAPKERAYMAAYARGVNYFLETHAKALPVEFTLLRMIRGRGA